MDNPLRQDDFAHKPLEAYKTASMPDAEHFLSVREADMLAHFRAADAATRDRVLQLLRRRPSP